MNLFTTRSHMGYEQVREWFAKRQKIGVRYAGIEKTEEDEVIDDQGRGGRRNR